MKKTLILVSILPFIFLLYVSFALAVIDSDSDGFTDASLSCPASLSWWKGDNDASDSSGTNGGTAFGGLTYSTGKINKAFPFDGVNDYINVPDSVSLDYPLQSFTIEGWINTANSDPSVPQYLISHFTNSAPGTPSYGYAFALNTCGAGTICAFDSFTKTWSGVPSGITANTWYHVAMVRTGTTIIFYVDGASPGTASVQQNIGDTAAPFRIGARSG